MNELFTRWSPTGETEEPAPARRHQPRYECDGHAEIALPSGGLRYVGRILNLSMTGCRVGVKCDLERGTFVEVYFEMNRLKFRVGGTVAVRYPGPGVGISFQNLSGRREADLRALIAELALRV